MIADNSLESVIFKIVACLAVILLQVNHGLCTSTSRKLMLNTHGRDLSIDEPSGPDIVAEESSIDQVQSLYNYTQSRNWKLNDHAFGQITAVDINKKGNVVIFHRGNHVWNGL